MAPAGRRQSDGRIAVGLGALAGWLAVVAVGCAAPPGWPCACLLLRWRRRASPRSQHARDETALLKGELRQRLAETGALLADGISGAPTMGASEAFEGDIEAAARSVLPEAGGQRAKAKELLRLRLRLNGHGAASGKLNGSEATLLAPARRAVAARQRQRCARRLRQGRRPGTRRCRGADAGGRPLPAHGQPRAGRSGVPAPDQARQRHRRRSCALSRQHHAGRRARDPP